MRLKMKKLFNKDIGYLIYIYIYIYIYIFIFIVSIWFIMSWYNYEPLWLPFFYKFGYPIYLRFLEPLILVIGLISFANIYIYIYAIYSFLLFPGIYSLLKRTKYCSFKKIPRLFYIMISVYITVILLLILFRFIINYYNLL